MIRRSSAQRRVLGVPEVELDALVPGQRRAPVDLRPAGDAGAHGEPAALALGVLVDLDLHRRPRAHERHLAGEHVDQVRQLVDRVAAQPGADAGDARVAGVDDQPRAHALGVGDHRAQLVELERLAVEPDAALAVDRVPVGLEPDQDRRHGQQRRREQQRRRRPARCRARACRGRSSRPLRRVPAGRRAVAQVVVEPGGERGGGEHVVARQQQRARAHAPARQRRRQQRRVGGDAPRRRRAGARAAARPRRRARAGPATRSAARGGRRS